MIITIFLKPANKKYLQKKYATGSVIQISDVSPIGWMLKEILQPKPRQVAYESFEGLVPCDFNQTNDMRWAHLVHIDKKSTYTFNCLIDEMLRNEFMAHMKALTEFGSVDINEAVYYFIESYDFQSEEITFDALRRYYSRFTKKQDALRISA